MKDLGVRYSIRRFYVDAFLLNNISVLSNGAGVLDLGGTRILKRGRFDISMYPVSVCYANPSNARSPDVQAEGEHLPFSQGTFDCVICTEVLEHVPDPRLVLTEVRQVLRENGHLLITAPFLYPIHGDPHDYGRHTDHYWEESLNELGFDIISLEKQGSFPGVLTDFLCSVFRYHQPQLKRSFAATFSKYVLARLVNLCSRFAVRADRLHYFREHRFFSAFTTGFCIVARKAPE